ncbi:unnamed protein product [Camellia sinensis]
MMYTRDYNKKITAMIVCSCELRHTHDKYTNTTNIDNSPRANMACKYLPNKSFSYKSTMISK